MNKIALVIYLSLITCICSAQKKNIQTTFLTSKYAGSYAYGDNIEKGPIGFITIYAESNNTILFYIELNRGAPSYNAGHLYGRVKITNGIGTFYTKLYYAENGCKFTFSFTKNSLIIKEFDKDNDCGFGGAVYAGGNFKKTSLKNLSYFIDQEGTKVYFQKTKPEDYDKD